MSTHDDMPTMPTTPLGVLRKVWSADGQTVKSLDDLDDPKICKRTEGLDFGDFGDAEGVGSGGDLRTAWRSKLAREGKLATGPAALSVRELVLGAEAGSELGADESTVTESAADQPQVLR